MMDDEMNGAKVESAQPCHDFDVDQERQAQRCLLALRAGTLRCYLWKQSSFEYGKLTYVRSLLIAMAVLNATPAIVEDSARSGCCLCG